MAAKAQRPSVAQLSRELDRERYRSRFRRSLRNTLFLLLVVAAVAVLLVVLFLPVLRITGDSMGGTLQDGDIVVSLRAGKYAPGDVVAFYYNNLILVKRVIAVEGDQVTVTEDGSVLVNDQPLEEPYVTQKGLGPSDIEYPYTVPEGSYFLMGDLRATSVDSRNSVIGCVSAEMMLGRLLFRVWPLGGFGPVA